MREEWFRFVNGKFYLLLTDLWPWVDIIILFTLNILKTNELI